MTDLRKEAKRTHNEIDLVHSNCLLQVQEMLEHNDFLTSQSQKIREYKDEHISQTSYYFIHLPQYIFPKKE